MPVQPRLYTDDTRSATLRGVGGNANDANPLFLRLVDQRRQTFGISGGHNDSVDSCFEEFLQRLGVIFAQGADRPILKLDTELRQTSAFIEDAAPHLIIEKMDLAGQAHTNPRTSLGSGQGASRQVRGITDLPCDLQNSMAG